MAELAQRPPVRVQPDTTLGQVVDQLCQQGRGAVLVEDGTRLIGIFSERDLMARVDHGDSSWVDRAVRDVMTPSPVTIRTDQKVEDALNLMLTGNYRHLPVVGDDGLVAGIVSIRDLLVHITAFFPAEFLNLPPDPDREARTPWGG